MGKKSFEVVGEIVNLLEDFSSDEKTRIIKAAMTLMSDASASLPDIVSPSELTTAASVQLPTKARQWVKTNAIAFEDLQETFEIGDGRAELIANETPGKNQKEKTLNAYILQGIVSLLASGEPEFDDKSARALCKHLGCYNESNHSTYLAARDNSFTRSGDGVWKLTVPGLKRGAELIREIVHGK